MILDADKFIRDAYVMEGIEFAISRMGLQFNADQEKKLAKDLFTEYLRVRKKKDDYRNSESP